MIYICHRFLNRNSPRIKNSIKTWPNIFIMMIKSKRKEEGQENIQWNNLLLNSFHTDSHLISPLSLRSKETHNYESLNHRVQTKYRAIRSRAQDKYWHHKSHKMMKVWILASTLKTAMRNHSLIHEDHDNSTIYYYSSIVYRKKSFFFL